MPGSVDHPEEHPEHHKNHDRDAFQVLKQYRYQPRNPSHYSQGKPHGCDKRGEHRAEFRVVVADVRKLVGHHGRQLPLVEELQKGTADRE